MDSETVWIVLFRGVGGATQLPVAQLREALTAAGFKNVATYINSGNALVRTTLSRDKATGKIAKIWRKVKVKGHAEEVLAAAKAL